MSATIPNPQQEAIVNAPIDVPLKVIAGAGTGKTQTLTNRFLRLVQEEGIPPERILAITFTEKAAAEMQARIRGALAKEGHAVELALSIYTFHGFARRLLRDHPEASGLSPDFAVLSDIPQRLILRRAFNDAAGGKLDADGLRLDDLAELDVKSLEDVRKATLSAISRAKGHRWTPDEFEQRARDLDGRFYDAMPDAATAEVSGRKKGVLSGEVYDRLRGTGFPCRERAACMDDEGHIRRIYYTNLQSSGVLKPDWDEGLAEQRRQSGLVLRTIAALFREYNRRLDELGALDFDDLILKAAKMLEEHTDVQAAARAHYRYLLVDEFQDTSPAQMDLIRAVATPQACPPDCAHRNGNCGPVHPVNVTIVGDKKQAIYAWRNARKENLDHLIPCRGEDVEKPLARNYRSAEAVIALANEIGRRVECGDPELEKHRDVAGRLHVPPIFADGKAKENKAAEAAYIAERIQALRGDGTAYGDIAILIRKASQFGPLREAFRRRNIPYVCEGAVGLFDEPVAKDTLCTVRAVARPYDDLALYRLLSRKPVGLSDAELFALRCTDGSPSNGGRRTTRPLADAIDEEPEGTPVSALRERLADLRRAAVRLPLPAFLEALPALAGFSDAWDEDDRALWPQVLATLLAAAAEAEQMAPAATVEDFLDLLDAYDDEDAATLPSPPAEAEGVRVMTVHKSKGLEFPVVFVPSIKSARKSDPGWTWDDDWGLLPDFAEAENTKRTVASWLRLQREVAEDEEDRCWYVAATRARDQLCVTGIVSNRSSTLPVDLAGRDTDPHQPEKWAEAVTVRRREDGEVALAPRPTEASGMRIAKTVSFSALSLFQTCRVAAWIRRVWQVPEDLVAPPNGNGVGRRVGDLFHLAAARWYAGQRDGQRDGLPDILFEPGDSEDAREGLRRRWEHFAASPCAAWTPVSIERRIRLRHPTAFGELDVSGYIDLVLPDGGEGAVLADFKTNHRLDAEHIAGYAMQLALYRMALMAGGEAVSQTGLLLHATPDGVIEIPVDLPRHEAALRALLEDYAEMAARGAMPERPDGADCEGCGYRDLCPRAGDGGAGGTAMPEVIPNGMNEAPDLDLFEDAWHPLVLALAAAGFSVEPGDEVRDGSAYLGMSVGVATGPVGKTTLIDAGDEHTDAAVACLRARGERAMAVRRDDGPEAVLDALGGGDAS